MEVSCPTVVICLEKNGLAVGERLAGTLQEDFSSSPVAVWAMNQHESGYALTPITPAESPRAQPGVQLPGPMDQIVADAIAASLSLGDCRITTAGEAELNLRLSVIGAPTEMQASLLCDLITSLHNSAQRHFGSRYLVEAFFLMPDLTNPAAGNGQQFQELLNSIDAPASDQDFTNSSVSYCWWLGRINARGLALPLFPDAIEEVASVVLGVLTTPLEQLPFSITHSSGQPQHMSVGYGELFISREKLFDYLRSRYTCHLIRTAYLDRRDWVDHKSVQKLVWEFTQSPECAGLLADVELTPGGDRIWKGFHAEIPAEFLDGDIEQFLAGTRDSSRKFFSELKDLRKEFELSGRVRCETFLTELENRVQEMVERSRGGLFETRAFLEEMESLLLENADVAEGEKAMNLQGIRRQFDRAFADTIQLKTLASIQEHESRVKELRRQLDRLMRLHNIFTPPALDAAILDVLRWRGNEEADATLNDSIAVTVSQLQAEVIGWAQATAGTEQVFQQAPYEVEPERARRDSAIRKAEESLCEAAAECRSLRLELELAHNDFRRRFFRTWRERSSQQKNERLAHLQGVVLRQRARELVCTHASRMQLSVDCIVYDVRSKFVHSALKQVRILHQKISNAIGTLSGIYDSCASVKPPITGHLLRRSFLSELDLEILLDHLTKTSPAVLLTECPSAWEICSQSAEKTAAQLKQLAGKPLVVILDWMIDDFLRIRKTRNPCPETLIAWLQNASQPLFPQRGEGNFEHSLIRASENSEIARIVRHIFPQAVWLEPSTKPNLSVLQLRLLPTQPLFMIRSSKELSTANSQN